MAKLKRIILILFAKIAHKLMFVADRTLNRSTLPYLQSGAMNAHTASCLSVYMLLRYLH